MQSMVPGLSKSFAEEATTEIRRLKGPFIVHCFSNGGFFMLSSVLQFAHHSSDKREKDLFGPLVDKIIFDSCPSVPMRPDTVARCGHVSQAQISSLAFQYVALLRFVLVPVSLMSRHSHPCN